MVDNIPLEVSIPLAIVLWLTWAILYRRDVIKERKRKRELERNRYPY